MIRGSKDAALAFALRRALNSRLAPVGEVTHLAVDTARRCARVRLALRGERQPLNLSLSDYELERSGGADWLRIVKIEASREWVQTLLEQVLAGRRVRVPRAAAAALRLLT